MSVQIYGQFSNYFSIANISMAVSRTLRDRRFNVGIYEIGTLDPQYLSPREFSVTLNSKAAVGICIGYPPAVGWLRGHAFRVLMTVCEATPVPREWAKLCKEVDLIIVPSYFCKTAFEEAGTRTPVIVVPHGVWPSGIKPARTSHDVSFLHVSGAASFPQRKGTPQLLAAFAAICKEDPRPILYMQYAKQDKLLAALEKLGIQKRVAVSSTALGLSPYRMAESISYNDAVVQPSRGEGFGLIPLEARCIGIPTILTATTGHAMHFASGVDVEVETGRMQTLQTQGNDSGRVPEVTAGAVYEALKTFLSDVEGHRARTQRWALENAAKWTWNNVLTPLIKIVKENDSAQTATKAGEEASIRGA